MYLTVYFDGQFWIGLVECADADRLRVVRHIFGAEPSDIEVLNFVWHDLLAVAARATVSVEIEASVKSLHNPKRAAREAAKIMRQPALSTKAQIALKLQHEQNQRESRQRTKADREAEADRKREIAREKAKQRQRGH
ncbi:MAG: YjdF family protein [Anaerolineae bacterium]